MFIDVLRYIYNYIYMFVWIYPSIIIHLSTYLYVYTDTCVYGSSHLYEHIATPKKRKRFLGWWMVSFMAFTYFPDFK